MANELAPYYLLQCSFAAGEISPEVANRVDLDKYNSAVLKARNCHIRPYGPIYKRPGMRFIVRTKYNDKKSILVPFNGATANDDYLLEIGHQYIRVHKGGQYLGVELATPFIENALSPAKDLTVAITDPKKQEAMVIADGDNFSLAIGKRGQNARLASKLTHYKIDIKTTDQAREAGINFR